VRCSPALPVAVRSQQLRRDNNTSNIAIDVRLTSAIVEPRSNQEACLVLHRAAHIRLPHAEGKNSQ
jgi:hypothetical protein